MVDTHVLAPSSVCFDGVKEKTVRGCCVTKGAQKKFPSPLLQIIF